MAGELWRIAALALLCAVMSLTLRPLREDFSAMIRIAACVGIFGWLIPTAFSVLNETLSLLEGDTLAQYVTVMLRAIGIALLTRVCTDICRDCGEAGTAGGVELAGKMAILGLCLPLIGEIVACAEALLEIE